MSGPIILALRIILALILYTLLGWIFISLWKDIQRQSAILAARKIPGISLTTLLEDDLSSTKQFTKPEIMIGRDPSCDIILDDEAVSARHARLTYHHNQWWLEDLSSTNGTALNQTRLSTPTVIISGDEISCGKINLRVALPADVQVETTQPI